MGRWDEIVAATSGIEIFVNPGDPAPLTRDEQNERAAFRRSDGAIVTSRSQIFRGRPQPLPNFAAD